MSVDCRGDYLVLFGTSRFFSESERLRRVTRASESCFLGNSFVTMATGIVNTLSGDVHELALPRQYNKPPSASDITFAQYETG
jgi:hypothetical protein